VKRSLLVMTVLAAGAVTLGACGGSSTPSSTGATSGAYGPAYARFNAGFPSKPTSSSDTKEVVSGFPAGVTTGTAYWVSPVADPLKANAKTPPVPTYLAVVGKALTQAQVTSFTANIKALPGAKPVTINGAKGYKFSGTEEKLDGSAATDPTATEAFMFLSKGMTLYAVIVVTAQSATALQFLDSFQPV
jgi:ABC-type phosphate/phosphonate transport system substrate-binding protein